MVGMPCLRRLAAFGVTTLLLVFGASGCPRSDWIQSTLVTVDVTGVWQGNAIRPAAYGTGFMELTLQQNGPKVTGQLSLSPGPTKNVPIEGSIAGDVFRFQNATKSVTGELQVNGDEMVGSGMLATGPTTFNLTRKP